MLATGHANASKVQYTRSGRSSCVFLRRLNLRDSTVEVNVRKRPFSNKIWPTCPCGLSWVAAKVHSFLGLAKENIHILCDRHKNGSLRRWRLGVESRQFATKCKVKWKSVKNSWWFRKKFWAARDFVTCDFVTLRCSHICRNSQSKILLLYYI